MKIRRWAGLLACAALLAHRCAFAQSEPAASASEEGERALERALTRQSVFVLPAGVYELEPGIEYTYRASDALEIVNTSGVVARQDVKQDRLETRLTLRAGLPHGSHVEIRVPYVLLRTDRSTADQFEQTTHEAGFGDLQLALTKQLAEERPARPGLLASVTWRAPTGNFRLGEPSRGSGFHALQGALTLVKRQDPLVFFGTASYTSVLERRHGDAEVDPGDPIGVKLGTILAASPRTSIRGGFELSRSGRTKIDGVAIPGSDAAVATLQFGLATLLSRRTLLDVQLNVGVTPDTPDFALIVSVPFRFQ
jgi:outer membrane putative beta-barrel porin/alpha-amylase